MPPVEGDLIQEIRRLLRIGIARSCPKWMNSERNDLEQAAMIRLLERLPDLDEAKNLPRSYLAQVAFTCVIDEIRRRQRRPKLVHEEPQVLMNPPSDHRPNPERQALSQELGKAIRGCLAALIAPRRRAMTLSLVGHPIREIARLLGWSPKRAANLVIRGRADLRACLSKKGYTNEPR